MISCSKLHFYSFLQPPYFLYIYIKYIYITYYQITFINSSSRQHTTSLICANNPSLIIPNDSSFSDPDSYDYHVLQEDQQQYCCQQQSQPLPPSPVVDSSRKSNAPVPVFCAADFSTSESSPPYQVDDDRFMKIGRFQSRSNPSISFHQSRILPSRQPNRRRQLQKSHSIGEEFIVYCREDSNDTFPYGRTNTAVRSRSHGDLNYYNSNSSSFDDNFRDFSKPAHYVPQVPYRCSDDSFVDTRWNDTPRTPPKGRVYPRRFVEGEIPRRGFRDRPDDGHDAGIYYGYESECSGAETEVFMSDRSFDRSFSQENDSDHYIHVQKHSPCDCTNNDISGYAHTSDPSQNSSLPILERISPEGPPRRPITRPRRLVRAKTEGSLIDCINREERKKISNSDYAIQSKTLPLRESTTKKKKESGALPQSILHKNSSKSSSVKNSSKQKESASCKNVTHAVSSRSVPPKQSDIRSQRTHIYNSQAANEDCRMNKAGIAYQQNIPCEDAFQEYGTQKRLTRRNHDGGHYSEDQSTYDIEDCTSPMLADELAAALPVHSLHFSNNTFACHPSKRHTYYCMERNAHLVDNREQHHFRMPNPYRAAFDGFNASPPEIQINNTRIRPSSSVSINEQPQYFEFDANSPPNKEYRVNADVDPSSNPASEFSQRMTGYGATGGGVSGKRGAFARSLSTGEVPETEKTGGFLAICVSATATACICFNKKLFHDKRQTIMFVLTLACNY